jgi:hydroxyacylglutathione hydrolase
MTFFETINFERQRFVALRIHPNERGYPMQVTPHIHALEIPFVVPIAPGKELDRRVFVFPVFSNTIALIDCGVAGAETAIYEYVRKNGRAPEEIQTLVLSHSHPDHIGAARTMREHCGCTVYGPAAEKYWIEDTVRQERERPVPGFSTLVSGPVAVDKVLGDGELLSLGGDISCRALHTPGHSAGSLSLFFASERVLFTGDALPMVDDLPIYDDIAASMRSIRKLDQLEQVETLLSSWEPPIQGRDRIAHRIRAGVAYLHRIHRTVLEINGKDKTVGMDLCRQVVEELGLPSFAANPLVARAFASSLAAGAAEHLFDIKRNGI